MSPDTATARGFLLEGGDPEAALTILRTAVIAGDGDAATILAGLSAAGFWLPQNWEEALDHLAFGAELGSRSAQIQLELLSPGWSGPDWRARRRSIRLEALFSIPDRVSVCEAPRIRLCEGLISLEVCDWLIGKVGAQLTRATTLEAGTGERVTEARTHSAFNFTVWDMDCVVAMVRERIARFSAAPVAAMEPLQILHYAAQEQFLPHVDYLDAEHHGGQRIATALVYLNQDYEGGATRFLHPGLDVRPGQGGAVVFANVDRDGQPDPHTLHEGAPPIRGEKWLLSQWIRDRPVRPHR